MNQSIRRSFLCRAAALIATCGCAIAHAQTTFQTVHQSQNNEWGTTIEREGTGYVMAGNIQQGNQFGVIVRRTNQFGNATAPGWIYTRPGGDMTAQSVRIARDNTIMVAGEITPQNVDVPNGIFLMKLDPATGLVIWMRVYRGTPFTGLGGTVVRELQGPQGGFVLIGRLSFVSNGQVGGVLITTDANGIQTCGSVYTAPQGAAGSVSFNDVRQNPSGDFTITGFWRTQNQGPRLPLALRTRCNQAPTWSRSYMGGNVNGDLWGEGLDLLLTSTPFATDAFAVTGPWRNANGLSVGSHMIVINGANGLPTNSNGYPTFLEAQSIRLSPGLRALIGGKYATAPQQPGALLDGALMRLQLPAGAVVSTRIIDNLAFPTGREFFEEVIPTPDGGSSATGDAQQYPFSGTRDILHVKTNVNLTSPSECDGPRSLQPTPDLSNQTRLLAFQSLPPQVNFQPTRLFQEMAQPDICAEIRGCVPTPTGLTLWLPLDEPAGVIAANVANPGFSGTHTNGPVATVGSFVANSRFYDGVNDFTQVNSYVGVEPAAGNFSIDAWVNTQGVVPQVIVNKFTQTGAGIFRGYSLYLQNGTLQCVLGTGGAAQVFNSGIAVPVNQWNFVAFVYNATANNVTFYVNNSVVTLAAGGAAGNKNTGPNVPFRVGSTQGAPTSVFRGNIDEVEFFRTALTAAQVGSIRDARQAGKCKQTCRPGSGAYCSATQITTNVTLWACNYGTAPTTFAWSAQGQGVGPGCSVQGPTTFAPGSGVTGIINPGQCVPIVIAVNKPLGMSVAGDTGCFSVEFTNTTTGSIFTCGGTVSQGGPLCGIIDWPSTTLHLVPPFDTQRLPDITYTNSSATSRTFDVRIDAIREGDSLDPTDRGTIGLNGLPPGQPVIRSLTVPGNSSRRVLVDALAEVPDPTGAYVIVASGDLDGDGVFEPLASIGATTGQEGRCDSIDFNNDGAIFDPQDIEALFSVFSEGPCVPGDALCNDLDFNNDSAVFDPCDITSFILVFSEGPCTPCGE